MKLLDIMTAPWAIVPEKLNEIRTVYATHLKGEKIQLKDLMKIGSPFASSSDPDLIRGYSIDQGVAVIPVMDVLTKNRTFFSYLFGGTSMRDIADAFQAALEDSEVHSIVLRIDSPGGTVDGTDELAARILSGRGKKPVVALADGMMASAAYWIGSAADKILIAGETVQVGSIGVVGTHIDVSKQDEMFGEKWTEITAGKYKRIASMHKPLSDEGRAYLQERVDDLYRIFVDAVAANRGLSVDQILDAADGKIFIGQKAIDAGLADGMSTLGDLISSLKGENDMNLEDLKAKHADLYAAAVTIGRSEEREASVKSIEAARLEGVAVGKSEGLKEGAEAERKRIQEVESKSVAGYEKVIAAVKYDGKTTASEAADLVLNAIRNDNAKVLNDLKNDGIAPAAHAAAPDVENRNKIDKNLPIEQRVKAEWDKDPELRAEFADNYDVYLAYRKAEESGRARILRKKD